MAQFLKVKTAEEVLAIIGGLDPLPTEEIPTRKASRRILACPIVAPEALPHFNRATMDGFAVRARDTFGASESLPGLLQVKGEVLMGGPASTQVKSGEAVAIPTGGMLPPGADAVVMVEYTQSLDEETIEVTRPVAPGDNVLHVGEDISRDASLFDRGRRLRPQDVGVLASFGIRSVAVSREPRVAILSTGDEIVAPDVRQLPVGKIRDINSTVLAAQVLNAGAGVGDVLIVEDDPETLAAGCERALQDHDVILLSGGSSVGVRDYTLQILDRFPKAELLVHGVAIRPGKPTILARIGNKMFCGLPGQPASAMIVFTAFIKPLLLRLQGLAGFVDLRNDTISAVLDRRLPSVHGRADYVRVALGQGPSGLTATPIFGSSAMMSTLIRADGYVIVPEHVEGYDRGSEVTVYLFDLG